MLRHNTKKKSNTAILSDKTKKRKYIYVKYIDIKYILQRF